jgi:hypothetical protein
MNDNNSALPAVRAVNPITTTTLAPSVFDTVESFESAQRMARALASSDLVPDQYRGNLANCIILLDIARRMRLPVLQVASGLNVIHGRPSWSAQFIISAINACGQFSPLRFEWRGVQGKDEWGARAYATDIANGEVLHGPWVDIAMAKAEKWYDRNGSKWRTMPEQMLVYRAGAFFGRVYAGHILSGMQTAEESVDIGAEVDVTPRPQSASVPSDINAKISEAADKRRPRGRGRTITPDGNDAPPPASTIAPPVTPAEASSLADPTTPHHTPPDPTPDAPERPTGAQDSGLEPAYPKAKPPAPDDDEGDRGFF